MKKIITLLLTFYGFSFAETSNLNLLGANFYSVLTYAIITLGVFMVASSFVKLKQYGDNPNQQRIVKGIFILMFGGAGLINFASFLSITAATLLGDEGGYCYIYESEIDSGTDIHNNCWNQNTADFISDDLLETLSKEQIDWADEVIKTFFAFIQIFGVYKALKFGFGFKKLGDGDTQVKVEKLIQDFLVALTFLNLPQIIKLAQLTLEWLGWI
ncbi:hypothetical protein A0H77_19620 [Vibrio alginolyticus]|uniref:hypothetical protein n=1 Tax=Vibrio alginolyticus TaxID=663 RepID=UPI0007949760|nr:hypothetical protein [Vibrio alginolyticus]KXZ35108.1 hypothetical protein A0H77_19620 [Vibrio alginolyticus]